MQNSVKRGTKKCEKGGISFQKPTGGWGVVTHVAFNGGIYKMNETSKENMTPKEDNWQGDTRIIEFYQEKLVDEGLSEEEYEEMDSLMKSTGMRG